MSPVLTFLARAIFGEGVNDRGKSRSRYRWVAAGILILPAAIPYIAHYASAGGLTPTGFIQADQPGYMAVAREYFDDGFSFTYSNPFSPGYGGAAVYFQPQTFLLGVVLFLTRLDPGLLFALFGLLAALICARVAIALFAFRAGLSGPESVIGLLLFFWGGGVLVIAGALTSPSSIFRFGEGMLYGGLFRWDPFDGWWFLNFGRNLVYPLEAYYHALFFGTMLALLRERYLLALGLLALLCISHPYSGSELLAIVTVWGAGESFAFTRNHRVRRFLLGCLIIGLLHAGYYLVYLPQFSEHRELVNQWTKPWFLDLRSAALAYGTVAVFAVWGVAGRGWLSDRQNRLLLFWAAIAFLLAKHELFVARPVEPLHFTRGYIWTPLFLLGLPVLLSLLRKLWVRGTAVAIGAVAVLSLVFLLDNAIWFTAVGRGYLIEHVMLAPEQRAVFEVLNRSEFRGTVVVTLDRGVATLSPVYTPLRPWTTQLLYTDSDVERRREIEDLFLRGLTSDAWRGKRLALVLERLEGDKADSTAVRTLHAVGGTQKEVLVNEKYRVFIVENAGG
jgi:hypothetical protein